MNTILTEKERRAVIRAVPFPPDRNWGDDVAVAIESAVLAKLREQEPVAVVGGTFSLLYASADPIATIAERHNLKVGSPLYAAPLPAVVQEPKGLIDAVDRVLEEAHCDCPQRLRFDDGEHLSGCPLFDLNVARLKVLAAPQPAVVQVPPIPLNIIRKWPDGFDARLQHVWKDVISFIPNVKLWDLQRVLAEFGFRMEVYDRISAPEAPATAVVQVPRDELLSLLQRARLYTNGVCVHAERAPFAVFRSDLDAAIAALEKQ